MPHTAERQAWNRNHQWTLYLKDVDERLSVGDVVFLGNQEHGIYAWGTVFSKTETNENQESRVEIGRGNIQQTLIPADQLAGIDGVSSLFKSPNRPFTFLTKHQVRLLNSLLLDPKPAPPVGNHFILNSKVTADEDLHVEYKNVAVSQIPKEAHEFAVAFARGDGGHTYFGVSDDGTVTGLQLGFSERNNLRKRIEDKLFTITPPLLAVQDYTLNFENIIDEQGNEIQNKFVIDFEVKPSGADHRTAGGRAFHKGYSGRREV